MSLESPLTRIEENDKQRRMRDRNTDSLSVVTILIILYNDRISI